MSKIVDSNFGKQTPASKQKKERLWLLIRVYRFLSSKRTAIAIAMIMAIAAAITAV